MNLTKLIIEHWKTWMTIPDEKNVWVNEVLDEGFIYCDGFFVSFWWILNKEWYKMNDKMYAYTGCEDHYVEPRDFEDMIND